MERLDPAARGQVVGEHHPLGCGAHGGEVGGGDVRRDAQIGSAGDRRGLRGLVRDLRAGDEQKGEDEKGERVMDAHEFLGNCQTA